MPETQSLPSPRHIAKTDLLRLLADGGLTFRRFSLLARAGESAIQNWLNKDKADSFFKPNSESFDLIVHLLKRLDAGDRGMVLWQSAFLTFPFYFGDTVSARTAFLRKSDEELKSRSDEVISLAVRFRCGSRSPANAPTVVSTAEVDAYLSAGLTLLEKAATLDPGDESVKIVVALLEARILRDAS